MSDLIDRTVLKSRMYTEAFESDTNMQRWDSGCWIRYKLFEKVVDNMPTVPYSPRWHRVEDGFPDDEVPVLAILHNTYGRNVVLKLFHIGHHKRTTEEYGWQEYEGETEYDEENDCFWIPEGWWESNYHEDNLNWEINETDGTITHWMPLPEPPKEDA